MFWQDSNLGMLCPEMPQKLVLARGPELTTRTLERLLPRMDHQVSPEVSQKLARLATHRAVVVAKLRGVLLQVVRVY